MASYTNMPADVVAMAKIHPFTGPLYKQDGSLALAAGKVMDDGTLSGMNWYVKGIDGKLPE